VTYHRLPILTTPQGRQFLRSAWIDTRDRFPFTTLAICLLPEHIHCIWTLPDGDANYPVRWKEIKRLFTRSYRDHVGTGEARNPSRVKRGEAAIWQRRYWEHTIRDEADLNRHLDYLHYNPVKHGLVKWVSAWAYSSFHRYVKMGYYERDWGDTVGEEVMRLACGE
jgi:putative transposase